MKSKLEIKAARLLALDSRRKAHNAALSKLHASPLKAGESHEERGLKMWRKLRHIEKKAHDAATAQCNGEVFRLNAGEVWNFQANENAWYNFSGSISRLAAVIFGGTLPDGFFVNGDCRGYSLKLDPEKCTVPQGMETDWGRYGILAAEINE